MLELLATGHLAALVDLSDDDGVAEVLLAVGSDLRQRAGGRAAVDVGAPVFAGVLAIIHALEAVDDEEEGLILIAALRPDLVTLLEEGGHVGLAAGVEAVVELQTLSDQLDLEETLFGRVEQGHATLLCDAVCDLEHHGGLA